MIAVFERGREDRKTVGRRDENGGRWGTFGLISAGADYLLSEKALIGLSFHFDSMTDPTDADAELTGNGWLTGPYASFELGSGVFLDTSLLYGGSWNDVDTEHFDGSFDTYRVMWDSKLQGQWQLGDATVLTPALRAVLLNETVDDYSVSNGDGTKVDLKGFAQEQLRFSVGAELERAYRLESGLLLTPRLGGMKKIGDAAMAERSACLVVPISTTSFVALVGELRHAPAVMSPPTLARMFRSFAGSAQRRRRRLRVRGNRGRRCSQAPALS
ncbi:hypothetical protein B0E45_15430 [Sinorhizobium sp. A49]|nr:hypothetical protein B0E45_15430 [Sinorhizobium sp. A49]